MQRRTASILIRCRPYLTLAASQALKKAEAKGKGKGKDKPKSVKR